MDMVGKTVWFHSHDDEGEPIVVHGTVESVFKEPVSEDALQRLNYSVRTDDGRVFTPYASECEITRVSDIRAAGGQA